MSNLNETLKKLNKKFNSGEIKVGVEFTELQRIPFASPRLNYMTYGGVPTKRLTEFSGAEGSGKTTTAMDIVASAQKLFPQRQVLFVDVESTFDLHWAKLMGVDTDNLILYRPDAQSAEDLLQAILELVDTGDISLTILDSVAAMVTNQQNEKDVGDKTYAGVSGVLTTFSKKIVPLLNKHDTTFIAINQLRDDLGNPHGGTKTVGGRAWKHACSVRLVFRKGNFIDDKNNELTRGAENPAGNIVNVALEKSKVFKSNRRIARYTLNYLNGIDYVGDTIDVAIRYDIIEQAGAWYYIKNLEGFEDSKYNGKAKLKDALVQDKKLFGKITEILNAKIVEN